MGLQDKRLLYLDGEERPIPIRYDVARGMLTVWCLPSQQEAAVGTAADAWHLRRWAIAAAGRVVRVDAAMTLTCWNYGCTALGVHLRAVKTFGRLCR